MTARPLVQEEQPVMVKSLRRALARRVSALSGLALFGIAVGLALEGQAGLAVLVSLAWASLYLDGLVIRAIAALVYWAAGDALMDERIW